METDNILVALAGNPNTGKSTIFNSLTGLNQHTGNWTGKTVSTARESTGSKTEIFCLWIYREHIPYFLIRKMKKLPVILFFSAILR